MDTELSLLFGGDATVLPEPAMAANEAGVTGNSQEAAVLKRTETAEGRESIERALCAFIDPATNTINAKPVESTSRKIIMNGSWNNLMVELRKENNR